MKTLTLILSIAMLACCSLSAQDQQTTRHSEVAQTRPPADMTSLRVGVWFPKDTELGVDGKTLKDLNATAERSGIYGLDIQYRSAFNHLLFLDFSVGAWYSDYTFKQEGVFANIPLEISSWTVLAPLTVGLGVSPLAQTMVNPFAVVGAGAYVNINGVKYKNGQNQTVINPDETKTHYTFGGFIGVGVDLFITPNFGGSLMVKYHVVKYNDKLTTEQQNFTGPQVQLGITTKL